MWIFFIPLVVLATLSRVSGQACGVANQNLDTAKQLFYTGSGNCLWTYTAPAGFLVSMECTIFSFAAGSTCSRDRVILNGGTPTYCATNTLTKYTTKTNTLEVRLNSTVKMSMNCLITSKPNPCDCGKKTTTRIVGGTTAAVNEFPYQAALTTSTGEILCSAAIIDPLYALTAAHCLTGRTAADHRLLVGEHDTRTTTETAYTRSYRILSLIIHPSYTGANADNDIALIRTEPMTFNAKVGAVCLPLGTPINQYEGVKVVAAGWGTTEFAGSRSPVLQKVTLDTITNTVCRNTFPALSSGSICTLTPDKDTCQYDSGGSLYYTNPSDRVFTIGVVSGGKGCALDDSPAINTRVTSYTSWIVSKATGATFCNHGG